MRSSVPAVAMTTSRRVLVADDHRVFADAIELELRSRHCQVTIVTDVDDIWLRAVQYQPRLCVLDLGFGTRSAMDLIPKLRTMNGGPKVLVVSGSDEPVIVERVKREGAAFLSKVCGLKEIGSVTDALLNGTYSPALPPKRRRGRKPKYRVGEYWITRTQKRILQELLKGLSHNEIAAELGIAVRTVESHFAAIHKRTGLERTALILWAADHRSAISA